MSEFAALAAATTTAGWPSIPPNVHVGTAPGRRRTSGSAEDRTRGTQHGAEEDRDHAHVPGIDPAAGGDDHGDDEARASEDELPPCRRRRRRSADPRS